jgi:F-type H+-transporting ATPase subunit epsilon
MINPITMMQLTIITPDKTVFDGNIQKVTFPGSVGSFQVLKNHAPLVSTLQKGSIIYSDDQRDYSLAIEEGVVEVVNNKVTVLVAPA